MCIFLNSSASVYRLFRKSKQQQQQQQQHAGPTPVHAALTGPVFSEQTWRLIWNID